MLVTIKGLCKNISMPELLAAREKRMFEFNRDIGRIERGERQQ